MKVLLIVSLLIFPSIGSANSIDLIKKKHFIDGKNKVIKNQKEKSYYIHQSIYLNKKSKKKKLRRKKRVLELYSKSALYSYLINNKDKNKLQLILDNWIKLKYWQKKNRLYLISRIKVKDIKIIKNIKVKNNNKKKYLKKEKSKNIINNKILKGRFKKVKVKNIYEIFESYIFSKNIYDQKNEMKYFKKISKFCLKEVEHEICNKKL